jgi:hypothetical protein
MNYVYISQCTRHEHVGFMKTTRCNTKTLAGMMVRMKKRKMCPVPEMNQGSEYYKAEQQPKFSSL